MNAFFRLLFVLALIALTPAMSYADDNGGSSTDVPFPIKKKIPGDGPIKHKAPSLVRIMFVYDHANGLAKFTLPADVEYIDIEAENLDSHIIYAGSVWAENPVWEQTLPIGEYIITCTADNGDVYEGEIYI